MHAIVNIPAPETYFATCLRAIRAKEIDRLYDNIYDKAFRSKPYAFPLKKNEEKKRKERETKERKKPPVLRSNKLRRSLLSIITKSNVS